MAGWPADPTDDMGEAIAMSYTRTRRSDGTAAELVKVARKLGFVVVPSDGTIDCAMYHPRTGVVLVDFKASAKAPKTQKQQALDRLGVPIAYIHSVDQLLAMVTR